MGCIIERLVSTAAQPRRWMRRMMVDLLSTVMSSPIRPLRGPWVTRTFWPGRRLRFSKLTGVSEWSTMKRNASIWAAGISAGVCSPRRTR